MKRILFLLPLFCTLAAHSQSYAPQLNDKRMKVKNAVAIQAYPFDMGQVKLLNSPFNDAMHATEAYLLKIDPDRLMAAFRAHSGLKPKATMYGGWENSGLAGHTLGHYLSACALQYAATGNKAFLAKVNYMVNELEACQTARKTGYIGAIPKEDSLWTDVSAGKIRSRGFDLNGAWSPWYTVHKVMAGLLDAYLYTNNSKALAMEQKMADWVANTITPLNEDQMQQMLICEYGGMAEVLVNTYALTAQRKYLDLSNRFYDKRILDSLAVKHDVLPGKHSNTQIPKVIASTRRYELTADNKDQTIANYFWETVVNNHSYANGGNSNYEYLGQPGKLNDKLSDNNTETCNTYNMLKLTRHLFAQQPSARYMDYYEKALYNHILASQNHSNGMTCYFVPLRPGGKKEFSDEFNTFTCCVGSGMENHVKYNESIYFKGADGSLYVNLFIPSVLQWKEKGITLKQESNIPASNLVTYTISAAKPTKFVLRLRKPIWANGITLKVNGKTQSTTTDAEGYLTINRQWKNNDKVELTLPAGLHSEPMPDNANRQALFYGPVLLAGILGNTEPDPVAGSPVMVTTNNNTSSWLKRTDSQQLVFKTAATGQPNDVELIPFYAVANQYYLIYWDVFTKQTWAEQQKVYEAKNKEAQALKARTIDMIRLGEMQPERDHKLTGEKISNGEDHLHKWRAAADGGYLTFEMKVSPEKKNSLIFTYWGMDNRERKFDILVNDKPIASEDQNKYKESRFYDITYAIPEELTKGVTTVQITLKPKPGNSTGPVYGISLIRE
ncbi:glycoside hydrolase family 127 protein [Mucilaginibacter terrae]|uniref:DUF1680 family protein n=1 Tax=Mucilaginibacter terrae TaxID=1955052 RepID=A0ABU3GXG7_9SPHI|nr:beta-L-arabinofuranosidase domain-containing protein [Mucilaginibacter terrae]MDT3403687.1 DUF1680 family protein [Mucilaginibacter terrae]